MFKVTSNVPPPEEGTDGRRSKYPLDVMKEGDAFFVPLKPGHDASKLLSSLRVAIFRWRKKHDLMQITFKAREHVDPDTGKPAVGVWRVT